MSAGCSVQTVLLQISVKVKCSLPFLCSEAEDLFVSGVSDHPVASRIHEQKIQMQQIGTSLFLCEMSEGAEAFRLQASFRLLNCCMFLWSVEEETPVVTFDHLFLSLTSPKLLFWVFFGCAKVLKQPWSKVSEMVVLFFCNLTGEGPKSISEHLLGINKIKTCS